MLVKEKEQEVRLDSKRKKVKATEREDRWLMTSKASGRESKDGEELLPVLETRRAVRREKRGQAMKKRLMPIFFSEQLLSS